MRNSFVQRFHDLPRVVRFGALSLVVLGLVIVATWAISGLQGGPSGVGVEVNIAYAGELPSEGVRVQVIPPGDRGTGSGYDGATPYEVDLPPGDGYYFIATAPGYRSNNGYFDVPKGVPTVAVEIPELEPAAGMVLVASNAEVSVFIDGEEAGPAGPDPAVYASFGPYPEGSYEVSAQTGLEEKTVIVGVSSQHERKVELLWGSRLEVLVEPADIPGVTILVDNREYTGSIEFDADRLSSRAYAQVDVQAPGYKDWENTIFFMPGEVTQITVIMEEAPVVTATVPATETISPAEEEVLAAFWNYWNVMVDGYAAMDAGRFSEVMVGEALDVETQSIEALKSVGMASVVLDPSFPTDPLVTVEPDGRTATVQVSSYVWVQTFVLSDGTENLNPPVDLDGTFTLILTDEDVWLVSNVESEIVVPPTPTPGPGGGGDGGDTVQPPDRGMVHQIILGSMNCGGGTFSWDAELADVLAPYADRGLSQEVQDELIVALQPLGAHLVKWEGLPLSYVDANAQAGLFAYNWPDYVGNPCATGYAESWIGKVGGPQVGMAIGTPSLRGGVWYANIIIAWRQ